MCTRRANFEKLDTDLLKNRNVQTATMKYGIEHEAEAAEAYTRDFGRSIYSVGFVINPTCPLMGCSPDRWVRDNEVEDLWGLLEIKCTITFSIAECKYLHLNKQTGMRELKNTHGYYYHSKGQLGLT